MSSPIPQKPPIGMIQALDRSEGGDFYATVTVPHDSPYVCGGALCPEMFLELMAQCLAAGSGGGNGYLAGIRDFRVLGLALAGERLGIHCQAAMRVGNVLVAGGEVYDKSAPARLLAQAQFRVFFMEGQ